MAPKKKAEASRRARGDGSLSPLNDDGTKWKLRVYLGKDPATGHPRQASRTVNGTRAQATKALRAFVAEVEAGDDKVPAGSFAELLEEWWRIDCADLRPSTRAGYRLIIDKHLIPALGHHDLRRLGAYELDSYYREKATGDKPLKPRTIRLHHSIVSAALTAGVRWKKVGYSVAADAKPPKLPADTRPVPTTDDVRRLLDCAAADEDIDLQVAVSLAAVTGARRGELAGLRWSDIDWKAHTLTIQRQRYPGRGGNHTGPLKHGDRRTLSLDPLLAGVLARYRRVQEDRARAFGIDLDPEDGWLLSYDGVQPIRAQTLGARIAALGERAGVPVTTHRLRHYAATEMVVTDGVDVVTAAQRLGHTPAVLMKTYAHQRQGGDREAAERLSSRVLGSAPAPPVTARSKALPAGG